MRAQEFITPQLREDIEDFPIANVRRPNGAIGNQGVNIEQAADVLTHAAGMQVSPDMSMRQLVDALRADPAAQQRLRQFVQKNPITVYALPDGSYHLQDGHHRTFLLNLLGDETVPAVVKEGVAEGSLNESAVFLNPTTVVVGQAHGQPLELSPDTLKKVQAIAAKHGAYYEGNGTDRSYTKGQIDRYAGSWDDEVAKTASPNDPKWLYVLFANVDENNRVERVGVDPKDTIFNRLMDSAQDNSFLGIGFTDLAL